MEIQPLKLLQLVQVVFKILKINYNKLIDLIYCNKWEYYFTSKNFKFNIFFKNFKANYSTSFLIKLRLKIEISSKYKINLIIYNSLELIVFD